MFHRVILSCKHIDRSAKAIMHLAHFFVGGLFIPVLLGVLAACGSSGHGEQNGIRPPSNLTYAQNFAIYARELPIVPNVPHILGSRAVSYEISPTLPPGLTLNPESGIISGVPHELTPVTNYTVIARNPEGEASVTLAIAVGISLKTMQDWDIVLGEDATPSETYAADEFQKLFALATGETLPISRTFTDPENHIFIGRSLALRLSDGFDPDTLGPEGYRIISCESSVLIAGGLPRGTLYGVYSFLEDFLGIRFLTSNHTAALPPESPLAVPPMNHRGGPSFEFRWSGYDEINRNVPFAVRLRNNGQIDSNPGFGGNSTWGLVNHSFATLIPASRYGSEHPDYFAERNGQRLWDLPDDQTQPCLSNPEVLRIVVDEVLRALQSNPETITVSVSQNDNEHYCQCSQCREIDEREESPMGSLLTFVNAVSEEIVKTHPKAFIGTLAYQYSRTPPRTLRPNPHVQIQLCTMECCQMHSIDDTNCPLNAPFAQDLKQWGAICDNLFIWHYVVNFADYLLPCPNFRILGPNLRIFRDHHVKGVFMQGAWNAQGAEFSELRNYLVSKLLWNPDLDPATLQREFLVLQYGAASQAIEAFITLVHDTAQRKHLHAGFAGQARDYGLDHTMAMQGLAYFQEALRSIEDQETQDRVEKAAACAYRLALEPVWYLTNLTDLEPGMAEQMQPLVRRYFEICTKHGITHTSELELMCIPRNRLYTLFQILD